MIQHIDVHAVLQESVSGVYADLVTRPTGRVVRECIERVMASAGADVAIARIDFTGVGCIDYSCADEIVAKLLRTVQILLLQGITEAHRLAIEPVLQGHGLAVVIQTGSVLEVLGPPEAAEVVCERLLAQRLAERTAGGTLALTAA